MQTAKNRNLSVLRLVKLALLTAISLVLVWLVHIPIFPATPFLTYDPADVSILIATFLYGPWAGLSVTAVVSLLQWLLINVNEGPYGALMHFIATGSMVIVAGLIYQHKKNMKSALLAMGCGAMTMTLVMIPANLTITPLFMGAPVQAVIDLLVWIILFNLIKSVGNCLLTLLLYKRVGKLLER